ncbi:MAG: hypothetical protein ACOH1Y_00115 [Propionicimonas sp.]
MAQQGAPEIDWRRAANPADLREYDAFGPWIEPIRSAADMPPAFSSHYAEHAGARFLLKVPRDEDRADLRPGMDLFAAVVAIHNEGVSVLRLDGGSVRTQLADWRQIVATTYTAELLVARWSLLLDEGTGIHLDHNSASGGGLRPAMECVQACISAATSPGWRTPLPAVGVGDPFYTSALNRLRHQILPPVVPIHAERGNRLCRDQRGRPRLSNGVLLLDAPAELVIFSHGEPMRSKFFPSDGSQLTRVPYERLTSFTVSPPPPHGRPSFHVLALRAGRQVIPQWFLDAPDAVVAALRARGVPQVDAASPAVNDGTSLR